MSTLLTKESPLIVYPSIAKEIGLNGSIILSQIHYLANKNLNSDENFADGYYWTATTHDQFCIMFPFFNKSTIKRTLKNLHSLNLIFIENHNEFKMDKTLWYRVNYDKLSQKYKLGDIYGKPNKKIDKNKAEYRRYLKTEHWKKFREEALIFHGCKCSNCGSEKSLNVHHLTYKNRGHEKLEDVVVLCHNCHNEIHGIKAGKR